MKKTFLKVLTVVLVALIVEGALLTLTGCREASRVSYNVSKEADNFNVVRRVTVINTRTDKCILQMVGKISIQDVTDGIAVLVEINKEEGIYQKHYIYLNEWTMYTVEDVSGVSVSPYAYEIEFMPQTLAPVKVTANELVEDYNNLKGDSDE